MASDKITERLGAIYTLEGISKESEDDYWTVMETLTAFVRERSPRKMAEQGTPENATTLAGKRTDIAAVLSVIMRRSEQNVEQENLKSWRFDFSRSDLTGAELRKVSLSGADLSGADLRGTNLTVANLTRANLTGALLQGADLTHANLTNAFLKDADLTEAKLTCANLTKAHLVGADLTDTWMNAADLTEAELTNAKLKPLIGSIWGLTREQRQTHGADAQLPDEFKNRTNNDDQPFQLDKRASEWK